MKIKIFKYYIRTKSVSQKTRN